MEPSIEDDGGSERILNEASQKLQRADIFCQHAKIFQDLFNTDIEFIVENAQTYKPCETVMSEIKMAGNFKFRFLIFPKGTERSGGTSVGAFVKAEPDGLGKGWSFPDVKFSIAAVHWRDNCLNVEKKDTHTFSAEADDRGWHDMLPIDKLSSGWLSQGGSLKFRATCSA